MIEIDLTCPNCGAPLEINLNIEKSFCPYCDSEFSVYRKLNEKLKKVKQLCLEFQDVDLYVASSENLKETQLYGGAKKHLSLPPEEDVFLICDMAFWQTCKKGLAICSNGLYLRGKGMKKSKHLTWKQFKTVSISLTDALIIDDVCLSTNTVLMIRLRDLLIEIQQLI